jgi:hypothetical protein
MRATIVAAALAVLAACAAKETQPAEAPSPAAAQAPEPAAKPAEVVAKPAEPAKPEAPKAATPAVPVPATPAPAVEAPKKRKTAQLGLPAVAALKDDVGMSPKQLKSCREIYTSYQAKLDEAAAKVKAATDKKAANKEVAPLRAEVLAKLREVCADDAQKAKFDAATARGKKKAATP